METSRKMSKLFIVLLFFMVLSFSFGCEQQMKYERNTELLRPVGNSETIDATTKNGDIVYNGNDESDFRVIAKIIARATTKEIAQRLAEETKVSLEEADNTIVKIEKPETGERESISVSLDITGPKAIAVVFRSKNGDIVVNQINKTMAATTKNGDIKGCGIGSDAIVESKNGDIELNQVGKNILAKTKNGDIRIDDVKGNSNIVSKNGDIDLLYESEAVGVSDIAVVSKNGNIKLKAPRWDSVHVQLVNENGNVNCQTPVQFRGKLKGTGEWMIGDGKNNLKISTTNGDIKIY